jgi:hypothetical protein
LIIGGLNDSSMTESYSRTPKKAQMLILAQITGRAAYDISMQLNIVARLFD